MAIGLTGTYSEIARLQKFSYQLWEKQVNARGGILGRPVKLIIHDDKSNAAASVAAYESFIQEEKVDFVFSPYSTPITLAVAKVTEKNGYPLIVAGASSDEIWKQGFRRLYGMYPPAGRYLLGFFSVLAQAGLKDIAIVTVDDQFSLSAAEGAKRWATEYDLRVVHYQVEPKKAPQLEQAAVAARDAKAQVLIMSGHYDESVVMRRALKQMNWKPAAYYAAVGPTLEKYHATLGMDAQGAFSSSNWEPREDLRWPGSADFLKAFKTEYQETPSYYAAMAYAACQVLEKAILKAGSVDREAVNTVLGSLDAYTIVGRYSVDRTGAPSKRLPFIVQWQNGKREIVEPSELRTAMPVLGK